jgi:ethanolamine permease
VLRRKEPDLPRGYRTPGGVVTTSIALFLAAVAVIATFVVDVFAASITAVLFGAALLYYWFYSRHQIVAGAPEEEFAQLAAAEAELKS